MNIVNTHEIGEMCISAEELNENWKKLEFAYIYFYILWHTM